jgi:ubiquinone/menaquinone biosynthesis C-methylase UbiE
MGAYGKFARFYDKMRTDVPYETGAEYLFSIWRKLGITPKSVLDLGCGTGSASLILSERGFDVTGIDLSEAMIKIAKSKTKKVKFLVGDMRTLKLEKKFDVVVCLCDSLNYLLKESEIKETFKRVYGVLKKGGAFIFDVNTIYKITTSWLSKGCTDFDYMHVCWQNNVDREMNSNRVVVDFFVKEKNGKFDHFQEIHGERGYPLEFLKKTLEKTGFRLEGYWDAFTFNPPKKTSKRVYFAAVK